MWKSIVIVAILLSVSLALFLPLSSPGGIFNTPDENANAFFANKFLHSSALQVTEPLEAKVENVIHPRGINVIHGFLVPDSFLGLPLVYGTVAKSLTLLTDQMTKPAMVHTPSSLMVYAFLLITLFALVAFYGLLRTWFDERLAALAWGVAMLNPLWLYWSGRPFIHTVLFLDLLIIGWWLLSRRVSRWDLVSGLLLGLALCTRTSEALWVMVGSVAILYSRARGWLFLHRAVPVVLGTLLMLIPLLFLNQDLYGSFFSTGYSASEANLVVQDAAVPQFARVPFLQQFLLPFGFHPIQALQRFVTYALGGMWWYAAPMLLGAIVAVKEQGNRKQINNGSHVLMFPCSRGYVTAWLLLSCYLILVYGSFDAEVFADPKHPLIASIGTPYLRYWLPIFVFGAPLVAQFLLLIYQLVISREPSTRTSSVRGRLREREISHGASTQGVRLFTAFTITMVLVFFSLRAIVWHGPESWIGIRETLFGFQEMRQRIERTTPDNAIFFVPRWADRIYFPSRKVVVDVEGKAVITIIKTLQQNGYPVFWHRGRGEIKLEPQIYDAGFKLKRRFDIDPKGKVYEII